jgi:hypothetical protein
MWLIRCELTPSGVDILDVALTLSGKMFAILTQNFGGKWVWQEY